MDSYVINSLKEFANRYETETFLFDDPSFFMHKVEGDCNQELLAFIASALSYGRRELFFPKIDYILQKSQGNLKAWITSGKYVDDIPENTECYYRLYNNTLMNHFIGRIKELIDEYGSLKNFAAQKVSSKEAFSVIKAITEYFNAKEPSKIIPKDTSSSCKRICMFLRWMVRDSSPVDLGIWSDIIDKRTLIMPMDVHVIQEATRLGLLYSKGTNMKTARKLTDIMLTIFPDDPLKGDFALFGYGVNH